MPSACWKNVFCSSYGLALLYLCICICLCKSSYSNSPLGILQWKIHILVCKIKFLEYQSQEIALVELGKSGIKSRENRLTGWKNYCSAGLIQITGLKYAKELLFWYLRMHCHIVLDIFYFVLNRKFTYEYELMCGMTKNHEPDPCKLKSVCGRPCPQLLLTVDIPFKTVQALAIHSNKVRNIKAYSSCQTCDVSFS